MLVFSKIVDDVTKKLACMVCGDEPIEGYSLLEREMGYDGEWYLKGYAPTKPQEAKEQEVRAVRNQYLEKYVDPYQLILRWNSLTQAEQADIENYRQYLLQYTEQSEWWEQNPMTLEEWKNASVEG